MNDRYVIYFEKKYNRYKKSLSEGERGIESFDSAIRCLHLLQTSKAYMDVTFREPRITKHYIKSIKAQIIKEQRYEDAAALRDLEVRGEKFLRMFSRYLIVEKV